MKIKAFKKMVKEFRKLGNKLGNKYGTMVWVQCNLHFENPHRVFDMNPYCVNLTSMTYHHMELDLLDGEYKDVPPLKESTDIDVDEKVKP